MTKDEFKQLLKVSLEAQSEVLTEKLEAQSEVLTEKLEAQSEVLTLKITELDNKLDKSISGLSKRMDGFQSQLNLQGETLMSRMDTLENDIRYNGVQIDQINHTIELLTESLSFTNERVESIDNRLAKVEEDTQYIPIIKNAIQNHAKRITALEKAIYQ